MGVALSRGGYAVEAVNLWRYYGGFAALRGVGFRVGWGEVFGLIGPNGAGKTTTLRILATLLKPSRGKAIIAGHDTQKNPQQARKNTAYLPEEAGAYRNLTGWEYLVFMARIYLRDRRLAEEAAEEGARISGLGRSLHRKVREYSKGMKRRLLLARTLMVKPKIALLDEPTSGLDVYHAVEVRRIIRRYVDETGSAVLLSSHNMLEVEYLCDRVAFIYDGRIIDQGTPSRIKEAYGADNLEEAFIEAVNRERSGGEAAGQPPRM